MRLVKILSILSILLALSALTAVASIDEQIPPVPNMFYGNVSFNGEWAQPGTIITAYVGDEADPREFFEVEQAGLYHISVNGSESDDGKIITFMVNGETANTAVWQASTIPESHQLDLIIEDLPASQTSVPQSIHDKSNEDSNMSVSVTPTLTVTVTPTEEPAQEPTKSPGFEVMFVVAVIISLYFLKIRK